MKAVYEIAGKKIEITSVYDEVHMLCREYRCTETLSTDLTLDSQEAPNVDLRISVHKEDILYERERMPYTKQKENCKTLYQDSYLETLAVYRKLAEGLLEDGILLFHGSVVAVDGIAYLFTAKSGTGKSTHTALWRKYFGERAVMINDDKPLLKITEEGVWVYGTPWSGKHRLSTNTVVPLKAICVLTRDEKNHIERVASPKVYSMLLQQTYRSPNVDAMKKTLKLLDTMMQKLEFYTLGCNMDPEAAVVAYEGMCGGKG